MNSWARIQGQATLPHLPVCAAGGGHPRRRRGRGGRPTATAEAALLPQPLEPLEVLLVRRDLLLRVAARGVGQHGRRRRRAQAAEAELAAAVARRAASSAAAQLGLDVLEAALDVVAEVLRRLVEEGGQVGVRVLLLEVVQLLQPLFKSKSVLSAIASLTCS